MTREELIAHISKLPMHYQLALSLRYVHKMDDAAIAECMMINEKTLERYFKVEHAARTGAKL